jgi:uncharacterized protein (TIGR02217 family)
MAEIIKPHQYAVLTSEGQVSGLGGYVALSPDGVSRSGSYAIATQHGAISGAQAYGVLVNPASIPAAYAYVAHRNDCAILEARGYSLLRPPYVPYGDLTVEFPFIDERFPVSLSYGSSGGPGFQTSLFQVDSGVEYAQPDWDRLRAKYVVEFEYVPKADLDAVENFFYAARGQGLGFRFKDWNDYQITQQNVVVGDGVTTSFQLFKRYRSGPAFFDRMIRKPVRGSINEMFLDGVQQILNRDFFVNYATGALTFTVPPARGAIGYIPYIEFDIPVRFATDEFEVSAEDHDQYSISSLELIEILV